MAEEQVRIEVGFEGGQILRVQVSLHDADALQRKLEAGSGGTAELELEDGRCLVVLPRVVYFRRYQRESRVGFTGG